METRICVHGFGGGGGDGVVFFPFSLWKHTQARGGLLWVALFLCANPFFWALFTCNAIKSLCSKVFYVFTRPAAPASFSSSVMARSINQFETSKFETIVAGKQNGWGTGRESINELESEPRIKVKWNRNSKSLKSWVLTVNRLLEFRAQNAKLKSNSVSNQFRWEMKTIIVAESGVAPVAAVNAQCAVACCLSHRHAEIVSHSKFQ